MQRIEVVMKTGGESTSRKIYVSWWCQDTSDRSRSIYCKRLSIRHGEAPQNRVIGQKTSQCWIHERHMNDSTAMDLYYKVTGVLRRYVRAHCPSKKLLAENNSRIFGDKVANSKRTMTEDRRD